MDFATQIRSGLATMNLSTWDDAALPGWLFAEKFDGVWAAWDGSSLRTRGGGRIDAPAWFVAGLPAQPVIGELWLGRGTLQSTVGMVKRGATDARWAAALLLVFDAPTVPGPKRIRLAAIPALIAAAPFARAVEHAPCGDVLERLAAVEATGGEGLVASDPEGAYEANRRSPAAVKIVRQLRAEARVVEPVTGPRGGASLIVEMAGGLRFRLATPCEIPPVGALVTYRYTGHTAKGLPRSASYISERVDLITEARP